MCGERHETDCTSNEQDESPRAKAIKIEKGWCDEYFYATKTRK